MLNNNLKIVKAYYALFTVNIHDQRLGILNNVWANLQLFLFEMESIPLPLVRGDEEHFVFTSIIKMKHVIICRPGIFQC